MQMLRRTNPSTDLLTETERRRNQLGWSMQRLARESGVGIDTVRKLERGKQVWRSKQMAIAAALFYAIPER